MLMDAELLQIVQALDGPHIQSDNHAQIRLARRALNLLARDDYPPLWALLQNTLGTAAARLAQENEEDASVPALMEQAVAAFEQATQVRPPLLPIEYWITAQRNLAMAYSSRILGDREANLAQSCTAYRTLLRSLSRQQSPLAWADIMMRLGTVYLDRFEEDRAANIEQAVECYQQALEVFRPAQNPVEWSLIWNNLGNAYMLQSHGLRRGEMGLETRAALVDRAIAAYEQALHMRKRATMPFEWAQTTMNLAGAYRNQALSGRNPDITERVLGMYKQVLEVLDRNATPGDWAKAQANLAATYHDRVYGERSANMEQAIVACQQALTILRPESYLSEWLSTQITMGDAYKSRIVGERAENLEASIAAYDRALQLLTPAKMPADWTVLINNLGTAYMIRIRGNRAQNLEQAIELFNQVLPLISRASHPDEWAMLRVNLGTAYFKRAEGNHADNIERALEYYEQALQARNVEVSPIEVASALTNLGVIYRERPAGNRAENIERAIALLEQALPIQTRETLPFERANTTLNLASAYMERAKGDRAENIERALELLGETLEIRTREVVPLEWAVAQMNLGTAYHLRVQGDRAANQEAAIAAYEQALTVRTRDSLPLEWAELQLNLANAYGDRIREDRAANIERSLELCKAALTVLTYEETPREWANAWQNLGNAYYERRSDERAEDLQAALAAYDQAMRVYSRAIDPAKWAAVMSNKAAVYSHLPADSPQDLERVVEILRQVLEVEKRESDPFRWARTQHNLGNAYARKAQAGEPPAMARAIAAYRQALEVRTLETLPEDHRQTQQVLGNLYFAQQSWAEAASSFAGALAAGDALYLASSTPEARQAELSETAELHAKAAYSLARLGRVAEAVVALEQGRARALSEALARHEVALQQATADDRAAFILAQERIAVLEAEARAHERLGKRDFLAITADLRIERDNLAATVRRIQSYLPEFLPAVWQFSDISRAVSASGHPLVYIFTTEVGSAALLVTPGQAAPDEQSVVWMDGVAMGDLQHILFKAWPPEEDQIGYLYGTFTGDQEVLLPELDQLARGFIPEFMGGVIARLVDQGYREAWLVAAGNLALLPLHSLCDSTVCWSLIPSARALQAAQQAANNRTAPPLFLGIGNPMPNPRPLVAARIEVEEIARLFPSAALRTLYETKATRAAILAVLPGATHLHFSCHGLFDWRDPLDSLLALAGEDRLTLRDILDGEGDLSAAQLVVLSACQTGIINFSQVPDEVVGFPAAFLQAGVAGVVSTLWPVSALATAILLIRFYEYQRLDKLAPAMALHQAQQWLRTATVQELKLAMYWMRIASQTWDQESRRWAFATAQFYQMNPDQRPFERPYYWGAFTFSGYGGSVRPGTPVQDSDDVVKSASIEHAALGSGHDFSR